MLEVAAFARPNTGAPWSTPRAILYGTLIVGVLDGLDAMIYWGWARGVSPVRVFQGIAAGLLGRASFEGGYPTALLGLLLHFFIACVVVSTYLIASRSLAILTRQAVACGLAYGMLVYFFMSRIVVPLSAAGKPRLTLPLLVNGLLIHAVGVGLPSALVTRATVQGAET